MSKYQHEDSKKYLIAEGKFWRVWNNGIVENCYANIWNSMNSLHRWERRLQFLKLWGKAEIGKEYDFDWSTPQIFPLRDGSVTFLGFKEECPECKQSHLIWEGKIQLCKGCEYIHAFMIDDN